MNIALDYWKIHVSPHIRAVRTSKIARRRAILIGMVLLSLFLGKWVYHMWVNEETDDAFITSQLHTLGPRISGDVSEVLVDDNQVVKKGQVLARLDPREYQAQLKAAQAASVRYEREMARWRGSDTRYLDTADRLASGADTANALSAEAKLEEAKLHLEYTEVVAPVDGRIGNKSVAIGEHVQPGQPFFSLVERTPWIVANFKESQVGHIRPGQEVEITVDAVPGHVFKGKVDSIAPGSGATFSLLAPDNATGNFTKVVQRIPVKIIFDPASVSGFEDRLSAGMSTDVSIYVGF